MAGYYALFDELTDDGYVLCEDWSSVHVPQKQLTKEEQTEREEWAGILTRLRKHYCSSKGTAGSPPLVKSTVDLMEIRLLPPCLQDAKDRVTTRTGATESRVRCYPKPEQLCVWDVHEGVRHYSPRNVTLNPSPYVDIFTKRLRESEWKTYSSERGEENYLLGFLNDTLVHSRIVQRIETDDQAHGLHGKPDFTVWVGRKTKPKLAVVGESKSTHNLLLPADAKSLVDKYKKAYKAVIQDGNERTTEWSHIAHPLAQLVGYMIDNKRRYGSLTSATRTYFIFLDDNGANMSARVSDPYFVGEATYLRAWSYIISLGAAQKGRFVAPAEWVRTSPGQLTPQPSPESTSSEPEQRRTTRKRGRKGSKGASLLSDKKPRARMADASIELTHVQFKDLKIGAEIGFGRNGSVFRVQWKNKSFALKQFDLCKGGYDAFQREMAAYMRLQDAWGRLVPEPMFVSESPSGAIRYLGLELGRDPDGSKYYTKEWSSVLKSLETRYGIRLPDSICSNGLILTREGQERMVAIDLEEWSEV